MLSVVCWKWRSPVGYRSKFTSAHVNTLRGMVARHYRLPHKFYCVTDDATGLDGDVLPLDIDELSEFAAVPSPHGKLQPSCYRRLMAWRESSELYFGPRLVSVDLDCVITGDLAPLWDRPEPCVLWGDALNPHNPYNGSMWLLRAGAHPEVFRDFNPHTSPIEARAAGFFGSDQAWYAHKLGPNMPRWTRADGVYSWRVHMAPAWAGGINARPTYEQVLAMRRGAKPPALRNMMDGRLPPDARIVFFHGAWDPWNPQMLERFSWIKDNYK